MKGGVALTTKDDSILDDTKKVLGIDEEDTVFDKDIILHINTCVSILKQYGVYPYLGDQWRVNDYRDTWDEYLGDLSNVYSIKDYIYTQVQILFDPPQNSFVADARNKVKDEIAWRIMTEVSSRNAKES